MADSPGRLNDPSVRDEELLYRGVTPWQIKKKTGLLKPNAFHPREGEFISVDRARFCRPEETVERLPLSKFVAQVHAQDARSGGGGVVASPELDNPAHADITYASDEQLKILVRVLTDAANALGLAELRSGS